MRKLSFVAPLCLLAACQATDLPEPNVESAPIVNGQAESGFPAVGALVEVRNSGQTYYGAFCTATLIAPQWLITAAHCLEGQTSSRVWFYNGQDANDPNWDLLRPSSQLIIHPEYDAQQIENDIALVKLQAPLSGVTPIPNSQTSLVQFEGDDSFVIGYGLTTGLNENTGGEKRSTTVPITEVYQDSYWSAYEGSGTCFGDSGGPSMIQINGSWQVVGITSSGPDCQGPNCDPCKTGTFNTRVDYYKGWIAAQIGEPIDCNDDTSICGCDEACQANGTCNDALCPATGTCDDGVQCWYACETADCSACANGLSPSENAKYQPLYACLEGCYQGADTSEEFESCVEGSCGDEWEVCYPSASGSDTCLEVYECWGPCETEECAQACFDAGSSAAQDQFLEMIGCWDQANCFDAQTQSAFEQCVTSNCASATGTCLEQTVEPTCTDNDGDEVCVEDGDCNDNNSNVYPNRPEICGNDVDDNCRLGADEGCSIDPTTSPTETTSPGEDTSSPGEDTSSPGDDATGPSEDTGSSDEDASGGTSTTAGADATGGNPQTGRSRSGCGAGGSEVPAVMLLGALGLVIARRRRMLGA